MDIIAGSKFGKLTVLCKSDNPYIDKKTGKKSARYTCICDCGNTKDIMGTALRSGNSKSCGCVGKKKIGKLNKKYNTYDLTGEYGIGYLEKGGEFYFDLEDYDKIKDCCWILDSLGRYIISTINKKCALFHRLILNVKDYAVQVDHIDHNRKDNRKINLRLSTRSENQMNRKLASNNTSGVSGVSHCKGTTKWRVRIKLNQKEIVIGYYEDLEEAAKARKEAEKKYFKEFAYKKVI